MYMYSLEFFIDKVDLGGDKLSLPDMNVLVIISDLLNFKISYNQKLSGYNALLKSTGTGKAVFFSVSDISELVSAFSNEIQVVLVSAKNDEETIANGALKWKGNFEAVSSELTKQNDHIECEVKHALFKDEKEIGEIYVQMCLVYFGINIEIPIAYMGSQLSVPLTFRRHSKMKKREEEREEEESSSSTWAPVFLAPKQKAKSIMDPGLEIYAEMAGIPAPTPIKALLTPDYINKNLCTHKFCPGAKKFKEFGLGPLAQEGSCLGSINSIKEVKPYGLYGMSQAYGTLDSYGAYGFFVKKSDKKRKSCCGSPDCPYTTFYGPPDEFPEGEDIPPTPTINELINKPKKCQCKNCKKHGSKQSSQSSTCASPKCPKKTPKFGVPCPHRQSAGADDWKYKPCCPPQGCTFASGSNNSRQSFNRQGVPCGGAICPANPTDCLGPTCNMTSCDDPNNKSRRRSSSSAQPTDMLDDLNSFLDKTSALGKQKNCRDRTCPFYEEDEFEGTDDNCENETCPANKGKSEQKYGLCAGKVCPLEQQSEDQPPEGITTTQKKKLSLLLNENGQKMLLGKNDLTNTEMFASLPLSEQSNMVLMISRLLEQRQRSHSLNNYYNPELSLSMQNFVSTMRLKSFDSGKVDQLSPDNQIPVEKNKRKVPCTQDSCKSFKYKRCSECGGISKSGATCDNTEVSFSTISYDSVTTPGAAEPLIEPPQTEVSAVKKTQVKSNKTETTVKIAKTKKRNSKFVYIGGENYPGVRLGHKTCVYASKNVPAHMGWLWNIRNEGEKRKRKRKWKPGYLRKDIEEAIINNRREKGIPDPPELKMLVRNKKKNTFESDEEEEEVVPKPTLLIEKKNGNYLITMHPLKDPKTLDDREDPYMRCKPIQFEITKPPKQVPAVPSFRGYDELEGEYDDENYDYFKNTCFCDGDGDVASTTSSDSELNIEFTTPAGIIIPEMFKKPPNVCNVDTQFKIQDFTCNDCPIIVPKKFKKERGPKKKKAAAPS